MDSYKKSRRKSIIAWVIAFVLAIGAAIVSFTPFIFMVLNSFKEKFEMLTKGVFQLPDQLNWSNYTEVLAAGSGRLQEGVRMRSRQRNFFRLSFLSI